MPRAPYRLVRTVQAALTLTALSCTREEPRPVYYPTPAGTYPTQYAPAPGAAPAPAAAQPAAAPGAPVPVPVLPTPGAPTTPAAPTPTVLPSVVSDPINNIDIGYLRGRAVSVMSELVANLPAAQKSRVSGIPLITDNTVGEVNAFASCTSDGKKAMAITDGLLDIQAHLAQARAIEELFGQQKVDEYIQFISKNQRPKSPIVQPPAGMFDRSQAIDGRKVNRQHEILDEQIAFVLGHELAHHYLGHLPCTASSGLTAAEVARVLSDTVPVFNQPNEVSADVAGVNNLLTTGAHRQGYRFTEGGALLTMRFFAGLDQWSPIDVLFDFERSHPAPQVRTPIIQNAANVWRSTGGQGLPVWTF